MKRRTFLLGAFAAGVLLFVAGCSALRLDQARKLAMASEPFTAAPPNPDARALVVGDSTAVGTGASAATFSVAGRLAQDHPRIAIVNHAEDGARMNDVLRQIEGAGAGRYDVILIQAGGNDVIRFTGKMPLRHDVDAVLAAASARAAKVIIMPSGNVGNAPFFYAPFSWVMTARSRSLHTLVREAAATHGATYVNLFKERDEDPFVQESRRLHAKDGLHPSDDGYALWYGELKAQSDLRSRLP